MNILVGLTGSVATIKAGELCQELKRKFPIANIQIVVTKHAEHFLQGIDLEDCKVYRDIDEWEMWKDRGDPVLHIEVNQLFHLIYTLYYSCVNGLPYL